MAYTLFLNGFSYSDTDFGPANYAQNFNKLIGDFYEHNTRIWYALGTFQTDTVFQVLNWNINSTSDQQVFNLGVNVVICSRSKPTTYRTYATITAVGSSGGNLTYTLNINAQIGGLPSASGMTDWTMSPTGTQLIPGGTLTLAQGGTGATTAAAALLNLGFITPASFMQVINEEFVSYASYATDNTDCGWFARISGYVNFAGHSDQTVLDRFPGLKLKNHPGIAHMYASTFGADATIAMQGFYNDTMPNGIIFSGNEAVYEIMFRINGAPSARPGEFSLRMGLTDNFTDTLSNEIGIGIRPFSQNPTEVNIVRAYSVLAGVYKPPSTGGSPYTGEMPLNTWMRALLVRSASGNMAGSLYGMDDDGNNFLVANLGAITSGNLPAVGLRPFVRLDRRAQTQGTVELLIDYIQIFRKLLR